MIDIFELRDKADREIEELRKRLDAAVGQYRDKIDMELMYQVMEDAANGRFSVGDIGAVYTYRLHKIIKELHDKRPPIDRSKKDWWKVP